MAEAFSPEPPEFVARGAFDDELSQPPQAGKAPGAGAGTWDAFGAKVAISQDAETGI